MVAVEYCLNFVAFYQTLAFHRGRQCKITQSSSTTRIGFSGERRVEELPPPLLFPGSLSVRPAAAGSAC